MKISYQFAPLAIDDAKTSYSSGNQSGVSYTMSGDTDGFFLNTNTGEMLGTFASFDDLKNDTKVYSITLKVVDASGAQQVLETMDFQVRYPDLEVVEYGPNRKGCDNGGIRVDSLKTTNTTTNGTTAGGGADTVYDPIKYDRAYVCECATVGLTTYSGQNCEDETTEVGAAATGGGAAVGGAVAGSFLVVLLAVGLIYRHHAHQIKMRAFDFAAELSILMEAGTIDKSENALGVPREIKRSSITMVKAIGQGAFGEVRTLLACSIPPLLPLY